MLARTSGMMLACIDWLLDRPLVWWCWLILDPPHSWSWRDRSGPCGLWMRRPFRCEAGRLVLTYLDYLYCRRSEGQTYAWVVFIWLGIYRVDSRLVQYTGTKTASRSFVTYTPESVGLP